MTKNRSLALSSQSGRDLRSLNTLTGLGVISVLSIAITGVTMNNVDPERQSPTA